jgi:hypothetical protein
LKEATKVHDATSLQRVAEVPVALRDGAVYADGALTAGPPPATSTR